jgi:hypothetical protein
MNVSLVCVADKDLILRFPKAAQGCDKLRYSPITISNFIKERP